MGGGLIAIRLTHNDASCLGFKKIINTAFYLPRFDIKHLN